jgi:hypothetical protein
MQKKIFVAALVLFAGLANAYPGLRFDPTTLVAPAAGFNTVKVQNTTERPALLGPAGEDNACVAGDFVDGGSCGAMRTACKVSHMGTLDPLIAPGNPDGSHAHTFIGNTGIDENTDVAVDLQTTADNTTCKGGIRNRTAYWFPSMIDVRTGAVLTPRESAFEGQSIYYKTLETGAHRVNTIPRTLRMITGTATSTSPQNFDQFNFRCAGQGAPGDIESSITDLPYCGAGNDLIQSITFPQCAALDGLAPFGALSGSYSGWKPLPTFFESQFRFDSLTLGNVTNLVVTAGGGAVAPTVVTEREGTASLVERAYIAMPALTAGQWIEVAGRRYTSTGSSTALQGVQALQGGAPVTNSPGHKSHVAHQGNQDPKISCPDEFPYSMPAVQLEIHYRAADEEGQKAMRLACDSYKGPAGYCNHADFIMGWDEDIHRAWVLGCDRTGGDCHSHLLGCKDPVTGAETQCRKMSF